MWELESCQSDNTLSPAFVEKMAKCLNTAERVDLVLVSSYKSASMYIVEVLLPSYCRIYSCKLSKEKEQVAGSRSYETNRSNVVP